MALLSTYYYAWAWIKLCGLSAHPGLAMFAIYFLIPILSWGAFIALLRLPKSRQGLSRAFKWSAYILIAIYLLFNLGGAIFIGLKQLDVI